jgi:trk system potassium uptake protein TrkH
VRELLRRPEVLLVLTFAGLITAGTLALQLPFAWSARRVGLVDALFTATSAACVTGLVTVDTATAWSRAGQVVVLLLIQLGGLGVLTFGAIAAQVLHFRVSFASQAALYDTFFHSEMRAHLASALRGILLMTFTLELAGMLLLCLAVRRHDLAGGTFSALFHAVSAFCNAGFSIYPGNAIDVRHSLLFVWTLMILITLGGLGYPILFEIAGRSWRRLRRQERPLQWTLNSKVVLRTSALLTFGGAALLVLLGLGGPGADLGRRLLDGLFQSVSARTAGYNTIDLGGQPVPALLLLILLMFVGGSPASCAGGVKTTSAAVWAARLWARLRAHEPVVIAHRRVHVELVRRATLVIALAALWNALGVLLLAIGQHGPEARLEDLIFEQISAFGTVGLSTGLTPTLTTFGKLWICLTMFVGRLGPLTLALAVIARPARSYAYPTERLMIG